MIILQFYFQTIISVGYSGTFDCACVQGYYVCSHTHSPVTCDDNCVLLRSAHMR